jgi:hypothetical protein
VVEEERIFLAGRFPDPLVDAADAAYWEPPDLRLAAQCIVAGVAVSILYVWTVLMAASILGARPPAAWFWGSLATTVVVVAAAFYGYEQWERSHWRRKWDTVSEFADPPYWR